MSLQGKSNDQGKPKLALLDPSFLLGMASVLDNGGQDGHDEHNWRRGITHSRNLSSAMRHILAFLSGETIDPKSGKHHLLHAGCRLMFAYWTDCNLPEADDRWAP